MQVLAAKCNDINQEYLPQYVDTIGINNWEINLFIGSTG